MNFMLVIIVFFKTKIKTSNQLYSPCFFCSCFKMLFITVFENTDNNSLLILFDSYSCYLNLVFFVFFVFSITIKTRN